MPCDRIRERLRSRATGGSVIYRNPDHFEIALAVPMTLSEFEAALAQITLTRV
jgi:hypothetical protein